MPITRRSLLAAALALSSANAALADEQVLNLYSARHYQTDVALYANFTKATGIKINRVDTDDAGLLARLKSEGAARRKCTIGLTNSYYLARMMRSSKPQDREAVEKIGYLFPNQRSWGPHVNIAGGAVARHTQNREVAIKFLEYLSSPQAQNYFANGNNEWPAVPGGRPANPALDAMGSFKIETIPIAVVGSNFPKVQQMLDRAGFK